MSKSNIHNNLQNVYQYQATNKSANTSLTRSINLAQSYYTAETYNLFLSISSSFLPSIQRKRKLTITLWALPEIHTPHIAEISRQLPPRIISNRIQRIWIQRRQTLQKDLLHPRILFYHWCGDARLFVAGCVVLADCYVD